MPRTQLTIEAGDDVKRRIQKWATANHFVLTKFAPQVILYKKENKNRNMPFYFEVQDKGKELTLSAWIVQQNTDIGIDLQLPFPDQTVIEYQKMFQKLIQMIKPKYAYL